jgi:hypothetical protein
MDCGFSMFNFVTYDAADGRTADRPDCTAAGQDGTTDCASTGADGGILVLPGHIRATKQAEQHSCRHYTDCVSLY